VTTLGVMKRLAVTVVVVLCLAGCGPSTGSLVTGDGPLNGGCYLTQVTGRLVFDPSYGTAIIVDGSQTGVQHGLTIVAWPPGETVRPNGSEFDVLDPQGRVVATTGQRYAVIGNFADAGEYGRPDLPPVWFSCGVQLLP
jgi:hypothetical protein